MGAAKKVGQAALHAVGGGAIAGAILWNPWLSAPALSVVGLLREQAQHRYIIGERGVFDVQGMFRVEKRTFSDWSWFRLHHAIEAGAWGLGGFIGTLLITVWR